MLLGSAGDGGRVALAAWLPRFAAVWLAAAPQRAGRRSGFSAIVLLVTMTDWAIRVLAPLGRAPFNDSIRHEVLR